jgi:leucyl aminopeptidase
MNNVNSGAALAPAPSLAPSAAIAISVATAAPATTVLGLPVAPDGALPESIGLDWAALRSGGFAGAVGSSFVIANAQGPVQVLVGLGDAQAVGAEQLRHAAAAFARAAGTHAEVAFDITSVSSMPADVAARAAVEGIVLARYRYNTLRREPRGVALSSVTVVCAADAQQAATTGAQSGKAYASATVLARDLANSPHSHLSATLLADLAEAVASQRGLSVEIFDKPALEAMGCGGLLGVNAGSAEPPRMIKLVYRPSQTPTGHLAFVGKGIMYDSGGLSLKPGDEVHAQMKNDMSGAAAVFAAMSTLAEVGCPTMVTAFLMCTDNMPSGTAMAMGDVITIRGGTTVEVINTDAEGRLVMADALVLSAEEGVDAIIDIATLTGACMRALGTGLAGVMGNSQGLVDQVRDAATTTDEPVWQLPLEQRYRNEIESPIADLKNLGSPNGGAIHAALFLAEFVGDVPWAHIDIAGVAQTPADTSWHTTGCSGFGARLLVQVAASFKAPGK